MRPHDYNNGYYERQQAQRDNEVIALAVLAGCNPVYDDYGHPERAGSQQYWKEQMDDGYIVYGYTKADCCARWLRRKALQRERYG